MVLSTIRSAIRGSAPRHLGSEVERRFQAIPVDDAVAAAYATIVAAARRRGPRARPFDALIAATAVVQAVPVYARDRDFLRLPGVKVELVK
jgi:hypothetical protein